MIFVAPVTGDASTEPHTAPLGAEKLPRHSIRSAKIAVFAISSAIAGLAGGFYGHYVVLLSPQMIDFSEMAKIVVMVVIGGFGTFLGPIVGAAPVQVVMTYLQSYGEWNLAVFALIVIVLMRFSMEGLASLFTPLWRWMWKLP